MGGYAANTIEEALRKIKAASVRAENGCLECGLTPSLRYPRVKVGGKSCGAAKIVYEDRAGLAVRPGLQVCHTCDNTRCVEPLHLYAGTPKQNCLDRECRGRSNPQSGDDHWTARTPEKLAKGESHGSAKLKEADIVRMLDRLQQGAKQRDVADEFGVSRGYVSLVANGKRWAHLSHSFRT